GGKFQGAGVGTFEHLEQVLCLAVARLLRLLEADRLVPALAAEGVDGLVGGNRVQPTSQRAAFLVLVALDEELEEGVLEHVFGQGRVSEVAAQVPVQLALVTPDEEAEQIPLTAPETEQEFLVGTECKRVRQIHIAPAGYTKWRRERFTAARRGKCPHLTGCGTPCQACACKS